MRAKSAGQSTSRKSMKTLELHRSKCRKIKSHTLTSDPQIHGTKKLMHKTHLPAESKQSSFLTLLFALRIMYLGYESQLTVSNLSQHSILYGTVLTLEETNIMKFHTSLMNSGPFLGSAIAKCLAITVSSYIFVFFTAAFAREIRSSAFPSPIIPFPDTNESLYIRITSSCALAISRCSIHTPSDSQIQVLRSHIIHLEK